jgi:hypothetical protein
MMGVSNQTQWLIAEHVASAQTAQRGGGEAIYFRSFVRFFELSIFLEGISTLLLQQAHPSTAIKEDTDPEAVSSLLFGQNFFRFFSCPYIFL